MTELEIKNELINRYKYIYENARYILLPYICKNKNIFINGLFNSKLSLLERFLLGNTTYTETEFYKELEESKKDRVFLKNIKRNLELVNENNKKALFDFDMINIDSWQVFCLLIEYINKQNKDTNKNDKLEAMEQYLRINRYTNDSEIWYSGINKDYRDCSNTSEYKTFKRINNNIERNKYDNGLSNNEFIEYLIDLSNYQGNNCVLTEKEKQKIYLTYHNELPWDLDLICNIDYLDTLSNKKVLKRPEITEPCHKRFNVIKDEIFVSPNNRQKSFYQLCPHCGYINNIPDSLLTDEIKKEILNKCKEDPTLFRKKYLYSELYKLYDSSIELIRKK